MLNWVVCRCLGSSSWVVVVVEVGGGEVVALTMVVVAVMGDMACFISMSAYVVTLCRVNIHLRSLPVMSL